jgi:hypothetical protein
MLRPLLAGGIPERAKGRARTAEQADGNDSERADHQDAGHDSERSHQAAALARWVGENRPAWTKAAGRLGGVHEESV